MRKKLLRMNNMKKFAINIRNLNLKTNKEYLKRKETFYQLK
jgi:hypothetical protein